MVDQRGGLGLGLLLGGPRAGFFSVFQLEFKTISLPESGLARKMYRWEFSGTDGLDTSIRLGGVADSPGFGIFGNWPRDGG